MKIKIKKLICKIVPMVLLFSSICIIHPLQPQVKISASEVKANYIILDKQDKSVNKFTNNYQTVQTSVGISNGNYSNIAVCKITNSVAEKLEEHTGLIVEKDNLMHASETQTINKKDLEIEWNKKMIDSSLVNRKEKRKKAKIAVIDSGVDWGNDIELAESISLVPGEENLNPLFMDGSGHGNSVAGLIAAKNNNEGITGINPQAEIYSIRVLDDDNKAPVSRVIQGIYYAINKNVDIINMSFGMKGYSEALEQAINDAEKAGILIIAAAGNTGNDIEYPAAFENVLSVGSVDSNAKLSNTSAREKLDIVAPGELVCSTGDFGDIRISSGTSLAAPQVAAVASVILQENPEASSKLIKETLVHSANYNTESGYGLLDEEEALINYKKIKEQYNSDQTFTHKNNTKIKTFDETGCVTGSWSTAKHEELVGSGHPYVKAGARYPDKNNATKTITSNPWWHGSYHTNYIASYIYATRMAEQLGKGNKASNASTSNLSSTKTNEMLADIKAITWKHIDLGENVEAISIKTDSQKRAFVWGMAMHTAADIFAHSAFVHISSFPSDKWGHLAHGGTDAHPDLNNYADNPTKYPGRYKAASDAVRKMVNKFDAKSGAGSYKEFCEINYSAKEYRLLDLIKNIKATTSNVMESFLWDYNLTNNPIYIDYYWKG